MGRRWRGWNWSLMRKVSRAEAAQILRRLVRESGLSPKNGQLEIELVGEAAEILYFANKSPRRREVAGQK